MKFTREEYDKFLLFMSEIYPNENKPPETDFPKSLDWCISRTVILTLTIEMANRLEVSR